MTVSKPMTGEQLDELMTVAVNMQREAETDCNRPSAMFAYAVQVAVLELRKVRDDSAALAAENAGLKSAAKETLAHWAAAEPGEMEKMMDKCMPALRVAYCETPATDAFLAEVRAQGVEMFGKWLRDSADIFDKNSRHDWADQNRVSADKAGEFADHLRKGVQS